MTPQEKAERSTHAMWEADAASRMLGMTVLDVTPGAATLSMTVRDDMVNGWDVCHGGLVAALADSAFAVACNSHGTVTVAAGFDIDLLEPAHVGDELVARAAETALRGRSGVYDVVVTRSSDHAVVAVFRGRSRSLGRPNPGVSGG
jgi:acyl-CoA thioesterase